LSNPKAERYSIRPRNENKKRWLSPLAMRFDFLVVTLSSFVNKVRYKEMLEILTGNHSTKLI